MKLPSIKLILLSICAGILILCSLPTENSVSTITAEAENNTSSTTNSVNTANTANTTNGTNGTNGSNITNETNTTGGTNGMVPTQPSNNTTLQNGLEPYVPSTAKLRVQAIDGRTRQPLVGAEVVLIENEKRYVTGNDGYTQWFDAPIIRNPKYRPLVAELHGQLGVIVYKNGYRDSIHLGVRMHEGAKSETTVWMYKIEPGDRRIEPVLYQVPYHHLWLIELADRFRQKSQIGEGPERP